MNSTTVARVMQSDILLLLSVLVRIWTIARVILSDKLLVKWTE